MPDLRKLGWALPGLIFLACHYDPAIPDGVAVCTEHAECPQGYLCKHKPGTEISVCCLTNGCGFSEEADAAVDAQASRHDLGPDRAADVPAGFDLAPDLATSSPDTADGPGPDLLADVMAPAPDLTPDFGPDLMPDAASGCPPSKGGPAMVKAGTFCVDSTEVTNQQYAAFLAAKGSDVSGQPTACKWNTSYTPSTDGLAWPYLAGRENYPVANVDWCDAFMFCGWAGKRLCGKVGGGRITSVSASTSTTMSQWTAACSGGGRTAYPYGNTFAKSTCNVDAPANVAMYVEAVKFRPRCEGGFPGLFDMSGNLEEWIDACDANAAATDKCGIAGSTAWTGDLVPDDLTCGGSIFGEARNTRFYMLGFRCCAD